MNILLSRHIDLPLLIVLISKILPQCYISCLMFTSNWSSIRCYTYH